MIPFETSLDMALFWYVSVCFARVMFEGMRAHKYREMPIRWDDSDSGSKRVVLGQAGKLARGVDHTQHFRAVNRRIKQGIDLRPDSA